ncbi:MAG: serine protease [Bacillota bacterium]|nr:serine protease [Bacillota bacterium]
MEIFEELNRRDTHPEDFHYLRERQRKRQFFLGLVAFVLALLFLFTVTGRWLSVFSGPAFSFLRESWALQDDPLVRGSKDAVVQIYVDSRAGSQGGRIRGSGFNIMTDGLIVTNRHLLEEATTVRVSFPNQGTFVVGEWYLAPDVDLAIIKLDSENLPTLSLTSEKVAEGDEVLVIGNPLQFARIANKGTLIGFRQSAGYHYPQLILEAMIYPGSSGSPVMDMQGRVVGIVFATVRSSDPSTIQGLAVNSGDLILFLEELDIFIPTN